MNLTKKVKSNESAFWLTIFAVLILSPNVFYMFYSVSTEMPWPYLREAQAFGVALYISWSIVYNTLKKRVAIASYYALFEMGISMCYYWLRLMYENDRFEWNWYIIPAFAFAIILPWSVKNYASTIEDSVGEIESDMNKIKLERDIAINLSNRRLEEIERISRGD